MPPQKPLENKARAKPARARPSGLEVRPPGGRRARSIWGSNVVEVARGHVAGVQVFYQRETVHCGKRSCGKEHGPYWYAYWRSGRRTRKKYIGIELRPLTAAEMDTKPKAKGEKR